MSQAASGPKCGPDAPEPPPKAASMRQRVVDWLLYRRRVPDLTYQIEKRLMSSTSSGLDPANALRAE
jgi:uncharacterized protein YjiS (DUF1127 family)